MSQVTWELPTGVRSMRTLADMLHEAAVACGFQAAIKGDSEWMGIFINHKQFWAGIIFNTPERLVVGTENLCVDPELAKALGVGKIECKLTGEDAGPLRGHWPPPRGLPV